MVNYINNNKIFWNFENIKKKLNSKRERKKFIFNFLLVFKWKYFNWQLKFKQKVWKFVRFFKIFVWTNLKRVCWIERNWRRKLREKLKIKLMKVLQIAGNFLTIFKFLQPARKIKIIEVNLNNAEKFLKVEQKNFEIWRNFEKKVKKILVWWNLTETPIPSN